MNFRRNHQKNEAEQLSFDIQHSSIHIYGKKAEKIFTALIKELEDCNNQRRINIFNNTPNIPTKAPFVQGDGTIEGLPDIICEGEGFVLGIEHFEFDAAGKNRKGSKMRTAEILAEQELRIKYKNIKMYPVYVDAVVNVDFSYDGYVQSLLDAFSSHVERKNSYIEKMKEKYPDKKILLAFYVEDVTAIGNYIERKQEIEPMYPLYVKEFLDELSKLTDIDFIISKVQELYVYDLHIQEINSEELKKLYENTYDMQNDKYISYHYKKSSHIYSARDN